MLNLKDFNSVEIKGTKNFVGGETGKFSKFENSPSVDFIGDDGGFYLDAEGNGTFVKLP